MLEEFEGKEQKKGAFRSGRIPGSIHIDWASCIDYSKTLKIKSISDLKSIFESKGVFKNKNIICYCHSGVRSAHTTFVLSQILNYPNVRNYDDSWVEWSYFEELPIEKGKKETPVITKDQSNYTILITAFIVVFSLLIILILKRLRK